MEYIEKTGKNVDEAITAALIQLGVSSDQVDIQVLEEGTKGILGLFGREAKVRVSLKETVENDILKEYQTASPKEAEIEEAVQEEAEQTAETVIETGDPKDQAKVFLHDVLEAMGIHADIDAEYSEEGILEINLTDQEEKSGMGVIIGKRGSTLDSLQYLTTMVINKNREGHVRVKLDTENYRERRQKTLENLAINLAKKVKKTGRRVILEPMNPYERRIIHSILQNDNAIETHSEGEEPYRKVVISLKRKRS